MEAEPLLEIVKQKPITSTRTLLIELTPPKSKHQLTHPLLRFCEQTLLRSPSWIGYWPGATEHFQTNAGKSTRCPVFLCLIENGIYFRNLHKSGFVSVRLQNLSSKEKDLNRSSNVFVFGRISSEGVALSVRPRMSCCERWTLCSTTAACIWCFESQLLGIG